ncbi:MAG: exodeoxyribonuclease VII large subunit [Saprospiraceae bacterium]|nr:exodeoxyribonuclease VII large subunit [Saprospiraceae bacterium]
MKKYSLYELQAYLQRVIALNFQEPLWVNAEIFQIKENRGHIYLDLIEKREDGAEVRAQCSAVLWSKNRMKIQQSTGDILDELLSEGTEVSLLVELSYHTVFGLKLSVLQIDPSYTLGKMELLRQETILRLKKEGLLTLNGQLTPSPVYQKIAVISSATASGYLDFKEHLKHNEIGYSFAMTLFDSAVQGSMMEDAIIDHFRRIDKSETDYDAIVLIRGGGSRLDLAGFDRFGICKAIATSRIPVMTGIGHESDTTVADLVSYRSFKTPTAVANYLIDHNAKYESTILEYWQSIKHRAMKQMALQKELLRQRDKQVHVLMKRILHQKNQELLIIWKSCQKLISKIMALETQRLKHLNEKSDLLNPKLILAKGYSLTYKGDKLIKHIAELQTEDTITTMLQDGIITSNVKKLSNG